jgi:hypothetical protein
VPKLLHHKSWLLPAFCFLAFLFFVPLQAQSATKKAIDSQDLINQVAESDTWATLLHVSNSQQRISDPSFLLSHQNFSLQNELQESLRYFRSAPLESYCRFPARHLYLSQFFSLSTPKGATSRCAEFTRYLDKVPYDKLSVIYASEVLSSASSMMGHVFLKAEGRNDNNNEVAHSVSFFTQYDTFNPLRLVYDGLIGGMDGFFIVRQYEQDLAIYSAQEQRNVFEYKIEYDAFSKQLIQLHIWELKGIDIKYLFQSYNCATLTLYILSLGDSQLKQSESLFVTPSDVVKAINARDLVLSTTVTLANKWEAKLLQQELGDEISQEISANIQSEIQLMSSIDNIQDTRLKALSLEYAESVITHLESQGVMATEKASSALGSLQMYRDKQELAAELAIDFSRYKNPIDAKQDSVFTSSLVIIDNKNINERTKYLDLSYLPASHLMRTGNKQFFSESELKIAEAKLRIGLDHSDIELRSFSLYSVSSFVPSTSMHSELSGNFFLGYRQEYNDYLDDSGFVTLAGGLGKTYKLHRDVMVFGMLDTALGFKLDKARFAIEPRIGTIFNLTGNTKLHVEYTYQLDTQNSKPLQTMIGEFSWSPTAQPFTVSVSLESLSIGQLTRTQAALNVDYHF